jgi:hypothetical protein
MSKIKRETLVTFNGADDKEYSFTYDENEEKSFAIAFNKIMEFPDSVIGHLDINDFYDLIGVCENDRSDMLTALIQKQANELNELKKDN